ncbi:DUF1810 domain-containing protein [Rhizobium sp. RU36D]|uniref:DUF1810 domain-containing protein n=1 Tax=Rhizobium sp. RU36D TaxID=1907415 RepID=UPI0009D881D2|nr:DUF1810 domain-containing protein [Rhizobium sp. RU36D]SMC80993.1 Uncharacterized protein, DUF1810 family [Rhizobium sp. RU36D]
MSDDPFDLQRFVTAQDAVWSSVLRELKAGRKASHWMWFVFPQIKGLGSSPTAIAYGISSLAEAQSYLQHPVLGNRLRECCDILLDLDGVTAEMVFGYPDVLKLKSCLTLFANADLREERFTALLNKFHAGERDELTVASLVRQ